MVPVDGSKTSGLASETNESLPSSNGVAQPATDPWDESDRVPHYVVGIGASAGGLDAIERFFDHVPVDSGLSYVLVQHLSPDFKSLMDELLVRHTKIPIQRVENEMAIEPDTIYLIPPKKNMMISNGRLLLTDQDHKSVLNLPIDIFFRSLAQDVRERAVGVILSGTGSDGSRGVREIHDAGGLVIVQDPDTAGFDGMPKASIATDTADFVLAPEAMPEKILLFARHPAALAAEASAGHVADDAMTTLFTMLRRQYGVDFTLYKPGTIARRLERRMNLRTISSLADYVSFVEQNVEEFDALYRDLLVEVTQFFRDPAAFDMIRSEVIPRIFEQANAAEGIRVWVPGCATGEEAYSVAMLLHAYRDATRAAIDIKVFATDIHRSSIDVAANGVYSEQSVADVPPALLNRHFIRKRDKYVVSPELRQMVLFAPHNITKDPPFTKLDLVSCRNLLIYLNPATQKKILSLFQFGLKMGGFLFLGPSERPAEADDDFEEIDTHWKIFRKRRDARIVSSNRTLMTRPASETAHQVTQRLAGSAAPARGELVFPAVYEALLSRLISCGWLVDDQHQLLHIFGKASEFLRLPEGRASNDLFRMVDNDLRIALSSGLHRAARDQTEVVYSDIPLTRGEQQMRLRIAINPIPFQRSKSALFLIKIEEQHVQPSEKKEPESFDLHGETAGRLGQLEQELAHTKEHLQTTIEELESSNEELQSTNEELVASNEELQSTNEELHSVNQELYTVNAEFQKKIEELTQLTNDMDNLLRCTDIGTIFLDTDMSIRKFTPAIAHVFNLLPQDIGRPLRHISTNITLEHSSLLELVEQMMATGHPIEREVGGPRGETFLMRILPYRTQNDVIAGTVLTFIDISAIKETQRQLESNERRLLMALEAGEICTWIWHAANDRFSGDSRFTAFFGLDEEVFGNTLGSFVSLAIPDDQSRLHECLDGSTVLTSRVETEFRTAAGGAGERFVVVRADVVRDPAGRPTRLFGVCIDVTGRRHMMRKLEDSEDLLRAILENSRAFIFARDLQGRYQFVNQPIRTRDGILMHEVLGKTASDLFSDEIARVEHEYHERVVKTGEAIETEEVIERADGPHTFLKTEFPLRDSRARVRGVGGISTDITALKHAESEVREALVRRDSFLAMLSHELRNPLATMLNATYLLQDSKTASAAKADAITVLQRQGEQMGRLLDDLLDVSRITQDKIRFREDVVNLREVIGEAIEVSRPAIEKAGLDFVAELGDEPLCVRGDSMRLQQMMVNLLMNAAKYTPSPGQVRVVASRGDNQIEVRVRDTGIGIDRAMLERVFDLFVQADPSLDRADGGMGVGLTLVRTIVQRHGGRITAHSPGPNQGSEFVFTLPECSERPASSDGESANPPASPLNVVIVEDNHDSRVMLERLLRLEGCHVKAAENGEEGVDLILSTRPDVALIDIGLPGLSGYDVARRIRAVADGTPIRLVALTGYGRDDDHRRVMDAGFNEHLVKPLKRSALLGVLRANSGAECDES